MLAFTFPGQGSQRPGMGTPWKDHPSFELVEQASDITGPRRRRARCCDADHETLKQTDNAQLATFVLSLIVLDGAERVGLEPGLCAGHSLGEYTALVASGALDYEDGLRLVAERGAAMQHAAEVNPGTMAAVLGLDDDAVESACTLAEGDVWVANYNAPGQVVIAGSSEAVAEAGRIAKEMGGKKVLPIPVGGAFHTPLMSPARDRLRKALASATFHAPEPAVVANVDARAHTEAEDWPRLLSAQLCSPVRWRQTLEALAAAGTQTFLELGPGGVLTGSPGGCCRRHETSPSPSPRPTTSTGCSSRSPAGAPPSRRRSTPASANASTCRSASSSPPPPASSSRDATLAGLMPGPGDGERSPVQIEVGGLIGSSARPRSARPSPARSKGSSSSPASASTAGQPVAWLRASSKEGG